MAEAGDNGEVFKDCLSWVILEKYATATQRRASKRHGNKSRNGDLSTSNRADDENEVDPTELAEFIEYLSTEIFSALPVDAQELSYAITQNNPRIAEAYSEPLTLSARESLVQSVPPSVTDTLTAYGLTSPPRTDILTFLTPALNSYVSAVASPPPAWHTTRPSACEICGRDWIPLSYHHVVPKAVHAKVLKRGWHEEHLLNKVAWLCRACHSFVHRMASNEELAREWHDVGKILERADVQKWRQWVGSVRWKKR